MAAGTARSAPANVVSCTRHYILSSISRPVRARRPCAQNAGRSALSRSQQDALERIRRGRRQPTLSTATNRLLNLSRSVFFSVPAHSPDKASDIRASANVLDLVGSGFGKGAIGVTYRRDLDAMPVRLGSKTWTRCRSYVVSLGAGLTTSPSTHCKVSLIPPSLQDKLFRNMSSRVRISLPLPRFPASAPRPPQGSSSRVTLEGKDTGDFAWSLSNTSKRMTLVLAGRGRVTRRGGEGGVASTVALRHSFRMF